MDYIVNDTGVAPNTPPPAFYPPADHSSVAKGGMNLPADYVGETDNFASNWPDQIRIEFTSFADGRGFSLAKRLRRAGFLGQLLASGYLLPDQYPLLRRVGFDAVEIEFDAQDAETHALWGNSTKWQEHKFRSRLDF